jgi:hypothetical protein
MRKQAIIFCALVLVAAAINVPFAMTCVRPLRAPPRTALKSLRGVKAAAQSWPERWPLEHSPWPPPDSIDILEQFGWKYVNAISDAGRTKGGNGYQMTTAFYGWPLPCLSESNRWWTWDDPQLSTRENPELPVHLVWSGVLLNPLLAGAMLWLLGVAPFLVAGYLRERRRFGATLCAKCGYPQVPSGVCPECGTAGPA